MKNKILRPLNRVEFSLMLTAIALIIGCNGCVIKGQQTLIKSTVFGFNAQTPGASSGAAIVVQLGLVRNEFWSNPTSTNTLSAAPYNSAVYANLSPINQTADEFFGTYQLPGAAYAQPSTVSPSITTASTAATGTTNTPAH